MDFLGTTTPADLLASVTDGVQTTGTDLWPIIVLVGIPLAFVIGVYVVSFIKGTVGKKTSTYYTGAEMSPEQLKAVTDKIIEIEARS